MNGFETIEEGSRMPAKKTGSELSMQNETSVSKGDKAMDMLNDNFSDIVKIAGDLIEIKKMKVASEAVLANMAEGRKRLLDEAEAYVKRKRADTSSVVDRMNVIRQMMQDFYANNEGNISGEDFSKIITEVVNQMGRVENGIK